jgi:dihydroorotase
MSVLIKKALIVDSQSKHHLKTVDILIDRGVITSIKKDIKSDSKNVIEGESIHVSPGWIDLHAEFNDPGFEHKEDLVSGSAAAKNGGFSTVVVSANNHPVTDTKSQINYLKSRAKELAIEVKSFATLSEGLKGQNFTELYDLHLAGAVGFSDGHAPIKDPDLLKRTLLYSKTFDGKVIVYPNDARISHNGVMHEGKMSTSLGLKSEPSLSEEIMIARDLAVAEYCDAPIHFMTISTAGAVAQIKRAKKRGIQVTCDVAIANLVWNDTILEDFNSNFKVTPPLRSEKDRKALIKGITDGTIDAIVTNHSPQNIEEKQCEFDIAGFGQSSIETAYSLYNTHLASLIDIETWVNVISTQPREIFKQQINPIIEGEKANITIFDSNMKWTVKASDLKSKSKNSGVIGETLIGKVIEVIS